ncbi:DUF3488 domain-containing transglutaminase family protein [Planctomycetales bacterium ZRK34]|nr:DUF3488 domain-containing transglutaminase family protein [Planctomycetales bacterium ZRK34]
MIRSFRRLIYGQVILGVIAYAVAEQNAAMVLAAGTLSTLSWYVVEGPGGKPLPRWLINLGVVTVTVWLFYTQVTRQKELIIGLGEFILCIQLFKLYERKLNRDYAQLIVLSLMQMVCASIISAEIVFGILLALYLVLTLFTLLQFQLKVSYDVALRAAMKQAPPGEQATRPRPVVSRGHRHHFNITAIVCGIGAMGLSAFFFVVLPRGAGKGILGEWTPPTRRSVSGFDDKVELAGGTRITTSRVPVMNVQLTLDGRAFGSDEHNFLMRGLSLDHYDRTTHRWTRTVAGDNPLALKDHDAVVLAEAPKAASLLHQQITLRRQTGGTLFAAYPPVKIASRHLPSVRFNALDQVLVVRDPVPGNIQYSVESAVSDPLHPAQVFGPPMSEQADEDDDAGPVDRREARRARRARNEWSDYARQPVISSPRLRAETTRILRAYNLQRDPEAESTPNDLRIASTLESYLQSHYAYTLDLPPVPAGQDPIMAFIFDSQRGHCEFFASAMTAMLRSVGIRSRVVTGFRATEFNGVGGYYVVREMNAHAWVEVYEDGAGWQEYDPSPPSAVENLQKPAGGLVALVRDLYEYMEFHWINGVITYDANQRRSVMNSFDDNLGSFTDRAGAMWSSLAAWVKEFNERWLLGAWGYVLISAVGLTILGALTMLVWIVVRRRRHIRQLQLEAVGRRDQRRLARHLEFYLQMLGILERAGFSKPLWQTPASFASQLTDRDPQRFETVVPLTDLFYEIRFGGRPMDASRSRQIGQYLDSLRQTVRPATSR